MSWFFKWLYRNYSQIHPLVLVHVEPIHLYHLYNISYFHLKFNIKEIEFFFSFFSFFLSLDLNNLFFLLTLFFITLDTKLSSYLFILSFILPIYLTIVYISLFGMFLRFSFCIYSLFCAASLGQVCLLFLSFSGASFSWSFLIYPYPGPKIILQQPSLCLFNPSEQRYTVALHFMLIIIRGLVGTEYQYYFLNAYLILYFIQEDHIIVCLVSFPSLLAHLSQNSNYCANPFTYIFANLYSQHIW